MKIQKKKFLGYLGLVSVIAMTVFAASIPDPIANAAGNTTTITVKIEDPNTVSARIISPLDTSIIATPTLSSRISLSNINSLYYKLVYASSSTIAENTITPSSASGEENINFDLRSSGYGEYILSIKGTGIESFSEDSVSFEYIPTIVNTATIVEDEDNNPVLEVEIDDEEVCYVVAQAYLKPDMTPIFDPEIRFAIDKIEDSKITIPFDNVEADTGDYEVKILSYGCGDIEPLYNPLTINIHYENPTPDTPKTGALLQQLNIAKADYITSGIIIFTVAGIASIVFIRKNNRKN